MTQTEKNSFGYLLPFILKWECKTKQVDNNPPYGFEIIDGLFTDNPNDKGGKTKWGIPQSQYPNINIENLTFEQAKHIYLVDYWWRFKCEKVPEHLRYAFFDCVVNQGGNYATRTLQALAGVKVDLIIGDITAAAAKRVTAYQFIQARRLRYLSIIDRDKSQIVFKAGWFNRLDDALKIQKMLNAK